MEPSRLDKIKTSNHNKMPFPIDPELVPDFYENKVEPRPKHGAKGGEYRTVSTGTVNEEFVLPDQTIAKISYSSGDISGHDIYCANCNHWNTVKGTCLLFSLIGECKNCGTPFRE